MSVLVAIRRRLERLGGTVLEAAETTGALVSMFGSTVAGVVRGGRPPGEVMHQMYLLGNRSAFFVAVTLGFLGMVMIYQSCLQLDRITGDLSLVGMQFAKILIQELGPTLTAMMLATRVGAGIAAEVGSMKVTEQIDALRMCGVRPIDYLIVPRFLAGLIMTAVLTVFGTATAYVAGGLMAWSSFGVNPRIFFDLSAVGFAHLGLGLIKALAYGMTIPVISGFCGLRAQGSSEGVGWATTAAVISSSFAVLVWDFIISAIWILVLGDTL